MGERNGAAPTGAELLTVVPADADGIVGELREFAAETRGYGHQLCLDAANEIIRLRVAARAALAAGPKGE